MIMIDICSGLGGASQAMKDKGWKVITIDNNPIFNPVVCDDLLNITAGKIQELAGGKIDLIWFSPPCTEFARESMIWSRTGNKPDLTIFLHGIKIINDLDKKYWIVENVKGAIPYFSKYLGKPSYSNLPWFLWGYFPDISHVKLVGNKSRLSSKAEYLRSKIPGKLSKAIEYTVKNQLVMDLKD